MSYITGSGLSLGYEGNKVVEDISFQVDKGNYLCIVGENGAGKSTLMKTILGLIPPIDGRIEFLDGLNKNEVGYLPQQTQVQRDFPASVEEIVLSGCQGRMGLRPFYNAEEKKLAKDAMAQVDISNLAKKCYRELSGGQQQRVLLARALCSTRKVILLDEPVSGLDPKATSDMYELIMGLNKSGVTIIMVTHDVSVAINYASHILHVGKKHFFGTKDEYCQSRIGKSFLAYSQGEVF